MKEVGCHLVLVFLFLCPLTRLFSEQASVRKPPTKLPLSPQEKLQPGQFAGTSIT